MKKAPKKKRKKRTTEDVGKSKIIKENERLVGCGRLASLFFRPKSAPLIALGIKSHSTKAAKEVLLYMEGTKIMRN